MGELIPTCASSTPSKYRRVLGTEQIPSTWAWPGSTATLDHTELTNLMEAPGTAKVQELPS